MKGEEVEARKTIRRVPAMVVAAATLGILAGIAVIAVTGSPHAATMTSPAAEGVNRPFLFTADIPTVQRWAFADGRVDFDEYRMAMQQASSCAVEDIRSAVETQGIEILLLETTNFAASDDSYQIEFNVSLQMPEGTAVAEQSGQIVADAVGGCQEKLSNAIENSYQVAYQANADVMASNDHSLNQCLADSGIAVDSGKPAVENLAASVPADGIPSIAVSECVAAYPSLVSRPG